MNWKYEVWTNIRKKFSMHVIVNIIDARHQSWYNKILRLLLDIFRDFPSNFLIRNYKWKDKIIIHVLKVNLPIKYSIRYKNDTHTMKKDVRHTRTFQVYCTKNRFLSIWLFDFMYVWLSICLSVCMTVKWG